MAALAGTLYTGVQLAERWIQPPPTCTTFDSCVELGNKYRFFQPAVALDYFSQANAMNPDDLYTGWFLYANSLEQRDFDRAFDWAMKIVRRGKSRWTEVDHPEFVDILVAFHSKHMKQMGPHWEWFRSCFALLVSSPEQAEACFLVLRRSI